MTTTQQDHRLIYIHISRTLACDCDTYRIATAYARTFMPADATPSPFNTYADHTPNRR